MHLIRGYGASPTSGRRDRAFLQRHAASQRGVGGRGEPEESLRPVGANSEGGLGEGVSGNAAGAVLAGRHGLKWKKSAGELAGVACMRPHCWRWREGGSNKACFMKMKNRNGCRETRKAGVMVANQPSGVIRRIYGSSANEMAKQRKLAYEENSALSYRREYRGISQLEGGEITACGDKF